MKITDPDAAILTGYAKDSFTRGPWYRYGDGALGRATTLAEYKAIMKGKERQDVSKCSCSLKRRNESSEQREGSGTLVGRQQGMLS